jgi:hypothetical protein
VISLPRDELLAVTPSGGFIVAGTYRYVSKCLLRPRDRVWVDIGTKCFSIFMLKEQYSVHVRCKSVYLRILQFWKPFSSLEKLISRSVRDEITHRKILLQ